MDDKEESLEFREFELLDENQLVPVEPKKELLEAPLGFKPLKTPVN